MSHVAHILLVEAETAEEARDKVWSRLMGETNEPEWSDWHNVSAGDKSFAGRWEGHFFGKENEQDVLCYADNPTLAEEVIIQQLGYRADRIAEYRAKLVEEGYDIMSATYDPYGDGFDMKPWYVKKIAQILNDDWTPDTYVFDLENYNASLGDFAKRVIDSPEKQFMIVVDFHF